MVELEAGADTDIAPPSKGTELIPMVSFGIIEIAVEAGKFESVVEVGKFESAVKVAVTVVEANMNDIAIGFRLLPWMTNFD